ncbi:hypothetical protein ILP92_01275 [Maribius pontilimi]|uniref:Uncharacterized protein n=1 Tax=Palleronia pontilimi TaxID=1964209 RepID=A0A934IEG9_9RHOB|nr:hypothetical protein [Palleronia pontilimi]MBJ3761383.1 hypothetical protein [Palleronia pontilimi]
MANSAKGAGNILGPLFIVAALVVAALAITFTLSSEEIPNEATIIADDDVEARPTGAGTRPEGEADETMEGITDQLDDVTPAAPGEDSVPPAEMADDGPDAQTEGETDADETTAGTDGEGVVRDAEGGTETNGNADAEMSTEQDGASNGTGTDGTQSQAATAEGSDAFLIEQNGGDGVAGDGVENASDADLPAGRDTQVELNPEDGQEVVRDTDDGGSGFVPTPSGPEGRDGQTIAD